MFNLLSQSPVEICKSESKLCFSKDRIVVMKHIYVTLMTLMRCKQLILKQLTLAERIAFQPRVDFFNFASFLANVTSKVILFVCFFLDVITFCHEIMRKCFFCFERSD